MLKVITPKDPHTPVSGPKPAEPVEMSLDVAGVQKFVVKPSMKDRYELFTRLAVAMLAAGRSVDRASLRMGVEMTMQAACAAGLADGEVSRDALLVGGKI